MGSLPRTLLALLIVAGAAIVLRNPPWTDRVTSGLRGWEEDPPGTRFRWTNGRGTFFIPGDATVMTLPLRAVFPGPGGTPVRVEVRVDDRFLATIDLRDPKAWLRPELPLGHPSSRRYRRVDLRISRVVPPFMLGVMVGEAQLAR